LYQQKANSSLIPKEMERILSSLANEDALDIFETAEKGIVSSTEVIKKLGLTQRRYYTRLKDLMKAGLVEKREGVYQHTVFGSLIYESVFKLLWKVLANKEGHELLGKLQSSDLTLDAKKVIAESLIRTGAVDFVWAKDLITPVKMIDTYESLVKQIVELANNAEERFCLVSSYADTEVIEAMMKAYQRGVKIAFVINGRDQKMMTDVIALRSILNPKNAVTYFKILQSADDIIRLNEVNFNFLIADDEKTVFEIMHPKTKVFQVAFCVSDKILTEKMFGIFMGLFKSGEKLFILKPKTIAD